VGMADGWRDAVAGTRPEGPLFLSPAHRAGSEGRGEFHFQGGLKGCDRGELALAAGEWEVSLPFGARGSGVGCGDVTQPCGLG
jgi:hypothetical protein